MLFTNTEYRDRNHLNSLKVHIDNYSSNYLVVILQNNLLYIYIIYTEYYWKTMNYGRIHSLYHLI